MYIPDAPWDRNIYQPPFPPCSCGHFSPLYIHSEHLGSCAGIIYHYVPNIYPHLLPSSVGFFFRPIYTLSGPGWPGSVWKVWSASKNDLESSRSFPVSKQISANRQPGCLGATKCWRVDEKSKHHGLRPEQTIITKQLNIISQVLPVFTPFIDWCSVCFVFNPVEFDVFLVL